MTEHVYMLSVLDSDGNDDRNVVIFKDKGSAVNACAWLAEMYLQKAESMNRYPMRKWSIQYLYDSYVLFRAVVIEGTRDDLIFQVSEHRIY